MKTKALLYHLSKRFPKRLAEAWGDYVGLMVGKLPDEVNRIVLCLDFDEFIYDEAKAFKPDLIITHHPFIYGTKKKVLEADSHKRELTKRLEKAGIPVYSMHTNFDDGIGGMNDALTNALHLTKVYTPSGCTSMRIGYLAKKMELSEFTKYAKQALNISYGLLTKSNDRPIKKVGIVGGGGSYFYKTALEEGCDIYISGDVSHHTRREMQIEGMNYLDLPHEIEKIFMPQMYAILKEIDHKLEILIIDHEKEPQVV